VTIKGDVLGGGWKYWCWGLLGNYRSEPKEVAGSNYLEDETFEVIGPKSGPRKDQERSPENRGELRNWVETGSWVGRKGVNVLFHRGKGKPTQVQELEVLSNDGIGRVQNGKLGRTIPSS